MGRAVSGCDTGDATSMTFVRSKVVTVMWFVEGATSAGALTYVARNFKAKCGRGVVVYVIYRQELVEYVVQDARVLTRIRNGVDWVFGSSCVVLNN